MHSAEQISIGDCHNGGQNVKLIKNDKSENEYIYKPHGAAVEYAFEAFLCGLWQEGFAFTLKCDILNIYHSIDACDINSGLMQGFAEIGYALSLHGNKNSGGMLV